MIFNKPVKTKEEFMKIRDKIVSQLGYYKHPKQLTEQDINWLKKNIKQFDSKFLEKIIEDSVLPDKAKIKEAEK
jgi:hypothetical protein